MTKKAFVYCSHCLRYSKAASEANFFSCSTCGKLIGEVNVKENSVLVMNKKFRFPRFKTSAIKAATIGIKPKRVSFLLDKLRRLKKYPVL